MFLIGCSMIPMILVCYWNGIVIQSSIQINAQIMEKERLFVEFSMQGA